MIPGLGIEQDTGHLRGVVGELVEESGDVGVFHPVGAAMSSPKEEGGGEVGGGVAPSSDSHQVWGDLVWEVHGPMERKDKC